MTVEDLKKFLNGIKNESAEVSIVVRDKDKDCIIAITGLEHDKELNIIKIVPNSRISIK